MSRLVNLPRANFGSALAHLGVGVAVLGIVGTSAWQVERIAAVKPGEQIEINGYTLSFKGVTPSRGPNFEELTGAFELTSNGKVLATLLPSKRVYSAPRTQTSEVGILATWAGDVYVAIGDDLGGGAYSVRAYFHPLVRLIWIGALIMAFGGVLSLADRRLRVGAPRRSKVAPARGLATSA